MTKTFPVTMGRSGIQMIEKLNVYDFVWGLTHINRYTGKGDRQVSVATHSAHCFYLARLWQPENKLLQLYALVHDFPEAYYGDFPGFLKPELGADFHDALKRIDGVIFKQLGLSDTDRIMLEHDLKRVDASALTIEASYAFDKFEPYHWPPFDLYSDTDILLELADGYDDVAIYHHIVNLLEQFGDETNEALRNTLHSNQPYSHPVRVR